MEKNEKSFEENLENLEKIVKDLENGDVPLNLAIDKFNEGMKLASLCNDILEKATGTKVIYQFYLKEPFYESNQNLCYGIQISKTEDIYMMI